MKTLRARMRTVQGLTQHIWVGLILWGIGSSAEAQVPARWAGRSVTGAMASGSAVQPAVGIEPSRNPLRGSAVAPAQFSQPDLLPSEPSGALELETQAPARLPGADVGNAVAAPPAGPAAHAPLTNAAPYAESLPPSAAMSAPTYSPNDPLGFSGGEVLGSDGGTYAGPAALDGVIVDEGGWGAGVVEQYPFEAPARLFSTRDWFHAGRWYSNQDFVLLTRSDMRNVPVLEDTTGPQVLAQNPITGASEGLQPQFGTGSARFNYEPGIRVSLGRFFGRDFLNRDHALEFEFFGLFDMSGQISVGLENPEFLAQTTGLATMLGANQGTADGFTDGVSAKLYHQSSLDSGEINWRIMGRPREDRMVLQPNGEWVRHSSPTSLRSFLAGFRYMSQDDSFTYAQFGQNAQTDNGLLQVSTQNDLLGIQFGGRLAETYSSFEWGLDGKLAGFLNLVERSSSIATEVDGTAASRSERVDDETLGILLEAALGGAYHIRPGLSLRASYRLMYLTNIASAYENISLAANFTPLDTNGEGLYHGLTSGLEWTW